MRLKLKDNYPVSDWQWAKKKNTDYHVKNKDEVDEKTHNKKMNLHEVCLIN